MSFNLASNAAKTLPPFDRKYKWQLSFALLIAAVVIPFFWKAFLYFVVFSGAGITTAVLGLRAKQSRPFSIGSGLIVGTLAAVALSAMIGNNGSKTISDNVQAGAASTASRPKRFHQPKTGEPVFFITPLFGNIRRSTFKYELLPCGAIRFIDAYDNREYCMTQPFEIRERPYLKSDDVEEPTKDFSSQEKAMNENPKFYRITSYLTAKGHRFSTFKYTISENGILQFFNRDTYSGMTIGPPYIIEETLLSPGVLPSGPDFPASN